MLCSYQMRSETSAGRQSRDSETKPSDGPCVHTWMAEQCKAGMCFERERVFPRPMPAAPLAASRRLSEHTVPVARAYLFRSGLGERSGLRGHSQQARHREESKRKRRAVPQVWPHLPPDWPRRRLMAAGGRLMDGLSASRGSSSRVPANVNARALRAAQL
ncbi:uncharacterized protein ACIGJ3_001606 [Trichechus inunguis]